MNQGFCMSAPRNNAPCRPSELPEELLAASASWCELWELSGLLERVTIKTSGRMTSSLGRACHSRMEIKLHRKLFHASARDLLHEVMCHELAHLVAYELHGQAIRPHGQQWKKLMVAAGYSPRVTIRRETLPDCMRQPTRIRRRKARRRFSLSFLRRLLPR